MTPRGSPASVHSRAAPERRPSRPSRPRRNLNRKIIRRPDGARLAVALTLTLTLTLALSICGASVDTPSNPLSPTAAPPPPAVQESRAELLANGRRVFEQHCQVCHGRRGNGRGELARGMIPAPRDFSLGLFKFRSTPSGALPTDDDLFRTIRGGLSGAAMPAFTALGESEIRAVIEHLKTLSSRWTNAANHTPPVVVPPPPPAWRTDPTELPRAVARGKTAFDRLCAACHGPLGDGNGPSAAELQDARGLPCPPRDLRNAPFRRGLDPVDLHRTLVTGLDGTPMPSFAETTDEAQRWDVIAFLIELRAAPGQPLNR